MDLGKQTGSDGTAVVWVLAARVLEAAACALSGRNNELSVSSSTSSLPGGFSLAESERGLWQGFWEISFPDVAAHVSQRGHVAAGPQ